MATLGQRDGAAAQELGPRLVAALPDAAVGTGDAERAGGVMLDLETASAVVAVDAHQVLIDRAPQPRVLVDLDQPAGRVISVPFLATVRVAGDCGPPRVIERGHRIAHGRREH
jgi:hypothetical protein